jgi:type I restriction enzyme S subunit
MVVESLITQHLDIWTSAIKTKSAAGRGISKKLELVGVKKLRELILELAVRGKLVPQDPYDEPASELLKKIEVEKAQLLKEGKIKKQKPSSPIGDEEQPFELPVGWEFVRLSEIGHDWGQKTPDSEFTYIDVGAINKELGFVSEPNILTASDAPSRARKIVKKGTVIYSTVRPYLLNIAVINEVFDPVPIASTAFAIVHPFKGVLASFIYRYLRSPTFINYVEGHQMGIAYPAINDKQFFSGILPLPPKEEQHRIVAKVDELMALCDQLETQTEASIEAHKTLVEVLLATLTNAKDADELNDNWQTISQHFDVLFTTQASIDQLKQTILQLAVMGKLVKQDPNDEPASKLLERIATEKQQLIKDGKIKKQKPLPPISDEEKSFGLPDGWEWSRIVDASLFTEYGTSEKAFEGTVGVPVLKMGDIQSGKVFHGGQKVVPSTINDLPNLYLDYGDVLYNRTNSAELVGKTGMFEGETGCYTFASYLIRIRCHFQRVIPQYLTLSMNTPLFRRTQIDPYVKQQCGQANVNGTLMKSMIVSIPPLVEQRRIISKVDELLALCDSLKTNLSQAQSTQLHLTDAIVEQKL